MKNVISKSIFILICAVFHWITVADIVTYYDAAGTFPHCSEAVEEYMMNCVSKSDFFAYMLSEKPILVKNTTGLCSSMGYEYVGNDQIFPPLRLYWKGGRPTMQAFFKKWGPGHPEFEEFMNATRDNNKGCASSKITSPTQLVNSANGTDLLDTVITYYDKSTSTTAHPQCSEGPALYMKNCVFPSDFFSYILSVDPVFITDKTCTELGYEFVSYDAVFSGFKMYWKGGAAAFSDFITDFATNHHNDYQDVLMFLNKTRDDNPSCNITH